MTGNERPVNDRPESTRRGMVIQERDRHLLRELAMLRVIDREQAKTIARFGSTTRVNTRLLRLTRAGLLRRFFLGTTAGGAKALYSLSAKGAHLVDVPFRGLQRRTGEALVADFFVQHQLVINEIYCGLKYGVLPEGVGFGRWVSFSAPLTSSIRLIPDGYVELTTPSGTLAAFLEVDLGTESLAVWKEKVDHYLRYAFSGDSERQFGQSRFRVVVIVNSERRLVSIRTLVAESTDKLFWFATQGASGGNHFFGPIWFRPKGRDKKSFLRERQ